MSTAREGQPNPGAEPNMTETAAQPGASESTPGGEDQSTYTGMASSAASNFATTATSAAAGVKDNVFSMFGGGAKKEKKEDNSQDQDRSGSSKAQKEAEAEDEEVSFPCWVSLALD